MSPAVSDRFFSAVRFDTRGHNSLLPTCLGHMTSSGTFGPSSEGIFSGSSVNDVTAFPSASTVNRFPCRAGPAVPEGGLPRTSRDREARPASPRNGRTAASAATVRTHIKRRRTHSLVTSRVRAPRASAVRPARCASLLAPSEYPRRLAPEDKDTVPVLSAAAARSPTASELGLRFRRCL
jgi:hypothetical protein